MSIENIRSLVRRKNLDRIFAAVVDYLEGLGDGSSGGGSGSQEEVQVINLPENFIGTLPAITSSIVEINTSGEETIISLPQGRKAGDVIRFEWNRAEVGQTLVVRTSVGDNGRLILDPSMSYFLSEFQVVSPAGFFELEWEGFSLDRWIFRRTGDASIDVEVTAGITNYKFEFNDDNLFHVVNVGTYDSRVRLGGFWETPEVSATMQVGQGLYPGQLLSFDIQVGPVEFVGFGTAFVFPDGTGIFSMTAPAGSIILLEWQASTLLWLVKDHSPTVDIVPAV